MTNTLHCILHHYQRKPGMAGTVEALLEGQEAEEEGEKVETAGPCLEKLYGKPTIL